MNLRRAFLLIDARHGIHKTDLEMMDMLDQAAVTYQVVMTKTDKISESAAKKVLAETETKLAKHAAAVPTVIVTSSEKMQGIDDVRIAILQMLAEH